MIEDVALRGFIVGGVMGILVGIVIGLLIMANIREQETNNG